MSTSSIVRIACEHKGRQQFWTVQQGGALRLGDASQAHLFVCRCEESANRSCFIQHLQSGAFIEQDETRKLQLALSAASAAVFSKLKAYSEGEEKVPKGSVWLRAATGGIVCSNSQGELTVTVNADECCHFKDCAFSFINADANSVLMKGLAHHTVPAEDQMIILSNSPQNMAPVSIGAKPLSPPFSNRSAAVPIALSRPIRKVSFSDLGSLDHSGSDTSSQKSTLLGGALPCNSASFSRSYTHKDAFTDRIPASLGSMHLHSEGSDTDESKVRGGHLFDGDQVSSSDLDEAFSGLAHTSSTSQDSSEPQQQLSSHAGSLQASTPLQGSPPLQASPPLPSNSPHHDASSHQQPMLRFDSRSSSLPASHQHSRLQTASRSSSATLPASQLQTATSEGQDQGRFPGAQAASSRSADEDKSCCGHQVHGACLYKIEGPSLRSTQSTSSLGKILHQPHGATHRAIKGHRTHGSQTALTFLSGGWSPSSPHRIPRALETAPRAIAPPSALEIALDITQSAPAADGLLANDGPQEQSHGSHILPHGPGSWHGKSNLGFKFAPGHGGAQGGVWGRDKGFQDASEALAGLRLHRRSGEYQREPVLPCISEGKPSQDSAERGVPGGYTNRAPPAMAALLDSAAQSASSPHQGMKRICSSPEVGDSNILLHPIHKVTPKGSPSQPSSPKRLHTHHGPIPSLLTGRSPLPRFGSPVKV